MAHLHNQVNKLFTSRRYFCWGGGKKVEVQPSPAPAPLPESSPAPTPSPSASSALIAEDARRKRIADMSRYGMQSTIKTSPQGIMPTPQLAIGAGASSKDKLGS